MAVVAEEYVPRQASKRKYDAQVSLNHRDIAAKYPAIKNARRRERCRGSLRLFCETYNPATFSLGWADYHLSMIARIEEAALHGALYAFAAPRGGGKSTIVRMAALWAVSYGYRRYVFAIGANEGKGKDTLKAIKFFIRFLPLYAEDFPEIAYPIQRLEGIPHRAHGQIFKGESTLLEWSDERLVLPTVPKPTGWMRHWPLRSDGKVPTAGAIIAAAGLTSDGIRGSLLTLSTGESIRPDLVLLDDPQTPESARSPAQNATREELIAADILGLAGPGKTISAVMPCTVIAKDDMVDRILDRTKNPLWRGERTKLLPSMPTNLDRWDKYFEVYNACAQKEPPDFREANAAYLADMEALDAGAVASWPARKLDWEISAVQSAMHLYGRNPHVFFAEYQNEPIDEHADPGVLTVEQIQAKANGVARGVVPQWAVRLTAMVDVQDELLFWAMVAWNDDFTGHLVDYGTFPDQKRVYYTLHDAKPTMTQVTGLPGKEARIFRGLSLLAAQLLGKVWQREDGRELRIERCLVDASYQTDTVRQWCRQCQRGEVLPSFGRYFGASAKPMSEYKRLPGERKGLNWIVSKHALFDSNFWKTFLQARLATPEPSKGCLSLFGDARTSHRLLADHLTAERRTSLRDHGTPNGRVVDEWKQIPGRDNHLLDCLVGCAVAASVQGSTLAEAGGEARTKRPRVSMAEMKARVGR